MKFFFLNRFYKFDMVNAQKKDKNYNKGKFEIKWGILRNKNQFKIFNVIN